MGAQRVNHINYISVFCVPTPTMMDELASKLQRSVRIDETSHDVLLVSTNDTGESVKADRKVLSKCSGYFRTLFEDVEMMNPKVTFVPNVSTDCIKYIVKYSYTGTFDDTNGNVLEVLSAAAFLQMPNLIQQCKQFIIGCLSMHNWVTVWRFARDHFTDLEEDLMQFVRDNFRELINESNIYELTLDEIVKLFEVPGLPLLSEVQRSEVFFRWLEHNPGVRILYATNEQ